MGYCERDAHAAAVLLARMGDSILERAPVWIGCLSELEGRELRGDVDLLTAGYPCPPYSPAGKGLGDADPRAIWPAIADLIGDVAPVAVLLENVRPHAFRQPFDDFQRLGFELLPPVAITAEEVGAPHLRKRWFALAYRDRNTVREWSEWHPRGRSRELRDGRQLVFDFARQAMADADGRRQQGERQQEHGEQLGAQGDVAHGHNPYGGFAWPPRPNERRRYPAGSEPAFRRVDDGTPDWVDRLRECGNAVIPAVVAAAWCHYMRFLR